MPRLMRCLNSPQKHKINIEPPHISNLVLPSGLNYMLKKSHYNVIK